MLAAISTGPETHLDHLAPLCFLLNIPLIVTNPNHLELGKKLYPMIQWEYISFSQLSLEHIAKHYDAIITCGKFWALELKPLLKLLFNKEIHFIFAPHGNSDKEDFLHHPIEQEIQLVYGPQMKIHSKSKEIIEMGNLRLWFYQKFQKHFDQLVLDWISSKKQNVLYAPTWHSKASETSFFSQIDSVISSLEKKVNLIVKLHPLLEENDPARFYYILGKYEKRITFIQQFPPIYPLLKKTDIYLGDFSSIGYDFLFFDRPMFFLSENGSIYSCGEKFQGSIENKQKEYSKTRSEKYLEAFGKSCDPEKTKALLYEKIGLQN